MKQKLTRIISLLCMIALLATLIPSPAFAASSNDEFFPSYKGNSGSIVTALQSLGINSSYAFRVRIAAKNGIEGYRGTAEQNTLMLRYLRSGKLVNPDAKLDFSVTNTAITYYETTVKTTLRSEPYEASNAIVSIPKNSTVMVSQTVTNRYGNRWYKALVYCNEGTKEGYIYSGKVASHTHSHETFAFNEITYKVCRCGDVQVSAASSAKRAEGKEVVRYSMAALPLTLGAIDGPLPIGDLIGAGILIVGTCLAHDILTPETAALAEMITEADFDEYLKKKEDSCSANSFRKVMRVSGKLVYIDKHCLDIVEAYVYTRFLRGDVYTANENNALLLAAMYGSAVMERDKDQVTYFYHYHFGLEHNHKSHIFFGTNDLGETPIG